VSKDLFISYTEADRAWAEWIAWQLEAAGHSVVLQVWDFGPGSNFVLEMHRAATDAQRTLLVVSESSLASPPVRAEWAARLRQDFAGEGRLLLPVRIEACDIEGLLGPIVYVDLVGLDEARAAAALRAGVATGRRKPKTPPGFPGARLHAPTSQPPRFPGALPRVWTPPHHRNPTFTGREHQPTHLQTMWSEAPGPEGGEGVSRRRLFEWLGALAAVVAVLTFLGIGPLHILSLGQDHRAGVPAPRSSPTDPVERQSISIATCGGALLNPVITVSPTTAAKGAVVRVTGRGFCPNERVKLFVDTDYYAGPATTDGTGNFTQDMKIPLSAPLSPSSTFIKARGTVPDESAMTSFIVG
jgi:hypothetical protein